MAGSMVRCPGCNTSIQVPSQPKHSWTESMHRACTDCGKPVSVLVDKTRCPECERKQLDGKKTKQTALEKAKPESEKLSIMCCYCSRIVQAECALGGKMTPCSHCGKEILVPKPITHVPTTEPTTAGTSRKQEDTTSLPLSSAELMARKYTKAAETLGHKSPSSTHLRMRKGTDGGLSTCRTCGKDISKSAVTCPHCGEGHPALDLKCPQCRSTNFSVQTRGYSVGRALVGTAFAGPIGLAGGAIGKDKLQYCCASCGRRWELNRQGELVMGESDSKNQMTAVIILIVLLVVGMMIFAVME